MNFKSKHWITCSKKFLKILQLRANNKSIQIKVTTSSMYTCNSYFSSAGLQGCCTKSEKNFLKYN